MSQIVIDSGAAIAAGVRLHTDGFTLTHGTLSVRNGSHFGSAGRGDDGPRDWPHVDIRHGGHHEGAGHPPAWGDHHPGGHHDGHHEVCACYLDGTNLLTARGEVAVEQLRVGDVMRTRFAGEAPIVWLGTRRIDCRQHPRPADIWPVQVQPGAFGDGLPHRELFLSPDHAVLMDGVLIPVRYLVNDCTIVQLPRDVVTYFHVELAHHDVLFAEGLPAESYLDTGNRGAFANGGDVPHLHADFALRVWAAQGCAELVTGGTALEAARRSLLERAEQLGHRFSDDAALHARVGARAILPEPGHASARFHLPPDTRQVRLVSRSAVPARSFADSSDHRRLGIAISRILLDGQPIALTDPCLGSGWHAAETEGGAGWRWTDGDAVLNVTGGGLLEVDVAIRLRYRISPEEARVDAA